VLLDDRALLDVFGKNHKNHCILHKGYHVLLDDVSSFASTSNVLRACRWFTVLGKDACHFFVK
jgi:hypothetical protein